MRKLIKKTRAERLSGAEAFTCGCGNPVRWSRPGPVLCAQCRVKREGASLSWITSSLHTREAVADQRVLETEATLRARLPAKTPDGLVKKLETLRSKGRARDGGSDACGRAPHAGRLGLRRRGSRVRRPGWADAEFAAEVSDDFVLVTPSSRARGPVGESAL